MAQTDSMDLLPPPAEVPNKLAQTKTRTYPRTMNNAQARSKVDTSVGVADNSALTVGVVAADTAAVTDNAAATDAVWITAHAADNAKLEDGFMG